MLPKVTIIVLNWNGKEDTIECLESLKYITYPNYEILLVDNGSTDGSVECFRERYPGMEIIENGENLGFAEGNNVGIRRAMDEGADYVLLLNNDTVVDPEFLGELVKVAESNPKIGFVGPKVYYYDRKGRKDVIHSVGAKIKMTTGKAPPIGIGEIDRGQYDKLYQVDSLEGACILAKINVINKIGLLNRNYFMYREEADWCTRANIAGYILFYTHNAKIWHKVGASNIGKNNIYFLTRNRFWFMKQYASREEYSIFLLFFIIFEYWFLSAIFIIYRNDIKGYISFNKGLIDGLRYSLNDKD